MIGDASRRLVLASGSPRRRELLELLGRPFDVVVADVDEQRLDREPAAELVARLSMAKARVVAAEDPAAIVIGADTVVVVDGDVLGKPIDRADAVAMLTRLSGRTHQVITGAAVVAGDRAVVEVTTTDVTFAALSPADVDAYVATGEPDDKAGAYGIQGLGGAFVTEVRGSYHNVVGLPVAQLAALLARFSDA